LQNDYEVIAKKVSELIDQNYGFGGAVKTVLRQLQIKDNWDIHFSEIGRILSERKKVRRGLYGKWQAVGQRSKKRPKQATEDRWADRKDING